ncbi:MAG: endolytic transglycosylase MltG [Dehalococcoidia bacterium]|nr:endolytic transglycosylase MltG [Dehalococcoidia bacterium]
MTPAAYRMLGIAALLLTIAVVVIATALVARTPGAVLPSSVPTAEVPEPGETTIPYEVTEGAGASDIGDDLETLGVIRSSRQFAVLIRLLGVGDELSAGEHLLSPGMSTPAVVQRLLVPEEVPVRRVTFPEGIRIEEMAAIAAEAGFGSEEEFLAAVDNAVLPSGLAENLPPEGTLPEGQRLQGYLFPDTYILPESAPMEDLVARMIDNMDERFTQELRDAAASEGLNTHEALTLASIVEREAVLDEERPVIAGVFYNRIRANDLIGADPTVQFAISLEPGNVDEHGYWKEGLTVEDLDNPSPYNTRRNPGIPPGPIANPGLASIEAVAFPEATDYYYFVANAVEGDGSHVFAETESEHLSNIAQYGAQ